MIRILNFIFLSIFILPPAELRAKDLNEELVSDFLIHLNAFMEKRSLDSATLEKLLGEVTLNTVKFKKGGVGVVDKDVFVILDGSRNGAVISGKIWEGKAINEPEIVITDGTRILSSLNDVDVNKIILLIFSSSEVRYINFSSNSGGRYLR